MSLAPGVAGRQGYNLSGWGAILEEEDDGGGGVSAYRQASDAASSSSGDGQLYEQVKGTHGGEIGVPIIISPPTTTMALANAPTSPPNETKRNSIHRKKKEKEKQEKHMHLRSRTYTTVAELLPNFRSFQPSVAQRQNVHNTSTRNEARLIFVQNLNPRRKIRKTIPMLPPPA